MYLFTPNINIILRWWFFSMLMRDLFQRLFSFLGL